MAGSFAHQPQGIQAIVAQFKALKKGQDDLRRMITGLGIQVDPDGNVIMGKPGRNIIVKGGSSINVEDDGNLNVDGNAVIDGTLNVTGSTVIGGTLSLPAGIIGNDALANPTAFGNYSGDTNSTTLTVAGSDIHTGTITVPAGFTRAQVVCLVSVGNGRDVSVPGMPFYAQSWIAGVGGVSGPTIAATCQGGASMSITTMTSAFVTGLSGGGHVTFGVWAAADGSGWSPGEANGHVAAAATFLR